MNQLSRSDRLIQIRASEFLRKALHNTADRRLTSRSGCASRRQNPEWPPRRNVPVAHFPTNVSYSSWQKRWALSHRKKDPQQIDTLEAPRYDILMQI
jgi:hypothetical protein